VIALRIFAGNLQSGIYDLLSMFYLAVPGVILVTLYYAIVSSTVSLFDRSGKTYHRLMRQWSRVLLWLFRIKVSIRGTENLDYTTNYVYLANHSSYLDIIAIGATVPDDVRFIFKEELGRIPFFGWSLKIGPYILMDRADPRNALQSIETAARQIREGTSVIIFPEGTRSSDGDVAPFKRGGLMLATKSGVPLVPVAIVGAYELLPRHRSTVLPGKIEVVVGKAIQPPATMSRADEMALQNRVREEIQTMLDEGRRNRA
jgi:1-acyl-sn-glycerol-3-phosphate acyltransferase